MSILWKADPAHSEVQFRVKHLMITTITGYFRKFDCEVVTETEDFNTATSIKFTADIDSIDTNNQQRDIHLKSDDFFNSEKFEKVVFSETRFVAFNNEATLQGNLSIRGITKPVSLNVEFGGMVIDPNGRRKAGFTVTGRISRQEFNLKWNDITEAGSVVVSDEVKIQADIQLVKLQ